MRIIVQKFGGSSLATSEIRCEAFQRVQDAVDKGYTPVVVVSAMGRQGDPYATDTLLSLMEETNPKAGARNSDLLISCGEIISATIFAEGLSSMGLPAEALTGWQCGIYTDDTHSSARVQRIHSDRIWKSLNCGKIPVITGFQGVTDNNEVTTLGRGGSDTTAAALGVVLQAECVEIYTDVDGVKTADPRLIPNAPTLKVLSYREVVELAHLGTQVVHPRAAEIAMEEGIPIRVLSTIKPGSGTMIGHNLKEHAGVGGEPVGDRIVTGIAHLTNRAHVLITGDRDFHSSRLAPKVFDLLAQHGVSVDLIFLSVDLIAFIIDESKVQLTRDALTSLDLNVKIEEGFAKVSVVGAGMHGVPGVMARVVNALERENIPIFQTTDSHANISCLVRENDVKQAVQALYKEFHLDRVS